MFCRSIRDDHHLQNKETGLRPPGQFEVYTKATHVRGLIDDEAEDEDEDILAENAEEEEILGDEDDLQDLIASTEKEKTGDKARRDALHRKWLEQQVGTHELFANEQKYPVEFLVLFSKRYHVISLEDAFVTGILDLR